jgi:hypothetical protein
VEGDSGENREKIAFFKKSLKDNFTRNSILFFVQSSMPVCYWNHSKPFFSEFKTIPHLPFYIYLLPFSRRNDHTLNILQAVLIQGIRTMFKFLRETEVVSPDSVSNFLALCNVCEQ